MLSPEHRAVLLQESAIADAVIDARGYRTVTDANELAALGFKPAQRRTPGLLLPLWTTDGAQPFAVYRPDNPRRVQDGSKRNPDGSHVTKIVKYEQPAGVGTRLDCPPGCRDRLADPAVPLWITEGQKKADALASQGLCAIALLGVWNWRGKNDLGGTTVLADFDYIALDNRDVRIVFDSDVMVKAEVRQALDRLTAHLQRKGAHVAAVYLPGGQNGHGKMGVDDFLAAGHTVADLDALIEGPRPAPRAAAPTVELLDAAPLALRRPLALLDGRAYAATWLWVRTTVREQVGRGGQVVKLNPPQVKTGQQLFVVRDDGRVFGPGGDDDLDALGLEVLLAEVPQSKNLWMTAGVQVFRAGRRPDPADVYRRVVEVVDRFIDFDRSLADQGTMADLVGCYILSTWFLPAFNVTGYLWPNGDRGSGKTHLLAVIAELSYMGQLILAGGSYASLRDLADYGATLAFDDAENMDAKNTDPDKRALLLAGNRRGAVVTVKEPGPDKTWRTRHVDAFCPRLFSAIRLPDNVLASRSIVIPLIRTPDRSRANSDPGDLSVWPHDRRQLLDDLWALALGNLAALPDFEKEAGARARLAGRNLEPWRAILAVALWLDGHGVPGLWDRLEALSAAYQEERHDLETSDLTVLVLRALAHCSVSRVCSVLQGSGAFEIKTAQLTTTAKTLIEETELDIDPDRVNTRRVGHVMRRLRFRKSPDTKVRGWEITPDELERQLRAYGLAQNADPPPQNATNATNATMLPDDADPLTWADDDPRLEKVSL